MELRLALALWLQVWSSFNSTRLPGDRFVCSPQRSSYSFFLWHHLCYHYCHIEGKFPNGRLSMLRVIHHLIVTVNSSLPIQQPNWVRDSSYKRILD